MVGRGGFERRARGDLLLLEPVRDLKQREPFGDRELGSSPRREARETAKDFDRRQIVG